MPPHELDPVTRLTADAIGEPGARTFLLQAASGMQQITLLVEKDQVRVLAERVIAWLPELAAEKPEDPGDVRAAEAGDLGLNEPTEPDFRVGQLALRYDRDRDRVVLVATELVVEQEDDPLEPAEEAREVRLWVTRAQLRVMARHGAQVVQQGRPPCPLCGNPLDPTGHVCPAQNGHRPTVA
jgi:uncharacterized repeat protein (TIGR03847 family)